jgi:hypothetical protein
MEEQREISTVSRNTEGFGTGDAVVRFPFLIPPMNGSHRSTA